MYCTGSCCLAVLGRKKKKRKKKKKEKKKGASNSFRSVQREALGIRNEIRYTQTKSHVFIIVRLPS